MGGVNHQPCSKFLKHSTKMSRALSEAHLRLESANVELENTLLSELEKNDAINLDSVLGELIQSKNKLHEFLQYVSQLREYMFEQSFQDLPTLSSENLVEKGFELSERRIVEIEQWNRVLVVMKSEGFYGVLNQFFNKATHLDNLLQALEKKFDALNSKIKEGESIVNIAEKNLENNFKSEFAQVYVAWNEFQSFFLASSIMSTELWYSFNHYTSLCKKTPQRV